MDAAAEAARSSLSRTFRWTDGHADFALPFRDAELLRTIGEALADPFRDAGVSAVVGLEARGFAVAALVARELGVGMVLARKPGNVHPDAEREVALEPDWRGRHVELQISRSAVEPGDRLLLADDCIETVSQARTLRRLLERMGAVLRGVAVVVDDASDHVRRDLNVRGLVRSSELGPSG